MWLRARGPILDGDGLARMLAILLRGASVSPTTRASHKQLTQLGIRAEDLLAAYDFDGTARLGGDKALILLAERSKGDDARMASYVRTLPAAYTVPLFWAPSAIQLLQYPTVQRTLLKTAKFVNMFATDHLDANAAQEAFSGLSVGADAFGWAIAAWCAPHSSEPSGNAHL